MPVGREESRLLRRLDTRLAREFAAQDHVILAFSGGLGSLVLAARARKQGDIRCVVVGTPGSADVVAAQVARDFLDYRLETWAPDPEVILRTAVSLRFATPTLALPEVLDLVPVALVEARWSAERVVSGFGFARRSPALRRHLATRASHTPWVGRAGAEGPSRSLVLRIGREAGVPESFLQAAHRSPAEGSGVGPVLRQLGHAQHRSVGGLLAASRSSS